jgi:protein TonB
MLEHEFFREVVEGLESEDPELIEDDLAGLSMSIRNRAGMQSQTGFNLYSMAATISLIILASVVIFVAVEWLTRTEQGSELSMNKPAETEMEGNRESPEIQRSVPGMDSTAEKQDKVNEPVDEKSSGIVTSREKTDVMSSVENEAEVQPEAELPEKIERQEIIRDQEGKPLQEPEQIEEQTTAVLQDRKKESRSQQLKRSEPSAAAIPFANEDLAAEKQEETSAGLAVNYMTDVNLPQPVGGFELYQAYLEDSLRYPDSALKNEVEGMVMVSFTVGSDSIPRQLSLIKSLGSGCDEEAIRLIREGPRWKPAITGGKIVESEMKMPVNFKLPGDGR